VKDQFKLAVKGMSCQSCVGRVEKALLNVAGISNIQVSLYEPQVTFQGAQLSEAISAVEKAGYRVEVFDDFKLPEKNIDKKLLIIPTLALLFTLPQVLSMAVEMLGFHQVLSPFAQFLLTTFVLFYCGKDFFYRALSALLKKALNMDVLVILGAFSAYLLSLILWLVSGKTHLYFETSSVLITAMLWGKFIEQMAKNETVSLMDALKRLRPQYAKKWQQNMVVDVMIKEINVGDLVIVNQGESFPVDGKILRGLAEVDESLITGESRIVLKKVGDKILSGSLNVGEQIVYEAEQLPKDSTLERIIDLIMSAQKEKISLQNLVDRISTYFIPSLLLVSIGTFIYWWLSSHSFETSIIHAISVVVVACPCAIGLAAPTALVVGTNLSSRKGILFKSSESIESLSKVEIVAFDKTGTITEGRPVVSEVYSQKYSIHEMINLISTLQLQSEHPLSQAVRDYVKGKSILSLKVEKAQILPGRGVVAVINQTRFSLVSLKFLEEKSISHGFYQEKIQSLLGKEETISVLIEDNEIVGLISFVDQVRDEVTEVMNNLKKRGLKIVLLTGDNRQSTKKISEKVSFDFVASELTPINKVEFIKDLRRQGYTVAMVGDGLNDAPVLSASDIGISMSSAVDLAKATSSICLMRNNLKLVEEAIDLSQKIINKVKMNLFWAFIYNLIAIPLAVMGLMSPMLAGIAMALSSISVVLNSLRINSSVQ